jgi:hypothetical protein
MYFFQQYVDNLEELRGFIKSLIMDFLGFSNLLSVV